jgi:hypothetical protein
MSIRLPDMLLEWCTVLLVAMIYVLLGYVTTWTVNNIPRNYPS